MRVTWRRDHPGKESPADLPASCSHDVLMVAGANASARGQRHAILASPLGELTGFVLVVDCGGAQCAGERSYALTALAACYEPGVTVGKACARCDARGAVAGVSGSLPWRRDQLSTSASGRVA